MLAVPMNGLIVRALGKGPMRQADLRHELGNPALTTLRCYLAKLDDLGAVTREGRGARTVEYALTEAGEQLLVVTRALELWLARAPQGPIPLGSEPAKGAVKALAGAWDSKLLRALAGAPLSLTQLDSLIGTLSYPTLERRLSATRVAGLTATVEDEERTPHAVTAWGRQGIGPIVSAAHFERLHMKGETSRLAPIDVEAAFLLATPIAALPSGADGVCSLIAETRSESRKLVGIEVVADCGEVVSCVARLDENPRNWVLGSAVAWLDAVVHHRLQHLRIGGDRHLACGLVQGLHELLFAV